MFPLTILTGVTTAHALNPTRQLTQYAHDTWSSRDGLPEGSILSVQEDKDGYLWLGTQCCLVRYDGSKFIAFNDHERGLGQYSFVRDVLVTPEGNLWAAAAGGVALKESSHFTWFNERNGLAHPFVQTLMLSEKGLWVGTGGAGLWEFQNGRFSPHPAYQDNASLPGNVRDVIVDQQGSTIVATDQGILKLGPTVEHLSTNEGLPSNLVNDLLAEPNGSVLIATREGMVRLTPQGKIESIGGSPHLHITRLHRDSHGTLWLGTNTGLVRSTPTGLESAPGEIRHIHAISEDRHGALWLATELGLERFSDAPFTTKGTREGYPEDRIHNILVRRAGGLWVLDGAGTLWIENNGQHVKLQGIEPIQGAGMLGLAETPDGSLWVAGRSLKRYKDGVWTSYSGDEAGFSVLLADGDGLLVAKTASDGSSLLYRFENGGLTPLPVPINMKHIQRLYRDRRENIWISTGGTGLIRHSPQGTKSFRTEDGLPHNVTYGITEDEQGVLWVATRSGLVSIDGDTVTSYGKINGMPTRSPVHLHLDGTGHLWTTADDGVYRLSLRELHEAHASKSGRVHPRIFTTQDGLRSVEISWRSAGQAVSPDGRLYYATSRGLAFISPFEWRLPHQLPKVIVEALVSGGETVFDFEEKTPIEDRRDSIGIHFSSPDLHAPRQLEFRHRLMGFNKKWEQSDSTRTAHFSNLSAGDYQFEVSARTTGGKWAEPNRDVRIVVPPYWYETLGARLGFTLASLLAAIALYRLQLLRVRRNERELAEKVAERTEALRQEVIDRQTAEAQTRQLARELEERVQSRTADLQRARHTAQESEERFALAVRGAEDGIWDWDLAKRTLYLSPRCKEILGYGDDELGSSFDALLSHVHPDDLIEFRRQFMPTSTHSGIIRHEHRMIDRNGQEIWVLFRGVVVFDAAHTPLRAAGSQTDITERKRAEEQRLKSVTHDPLTGLPNRSLFSDRLNQAILRKEQDSSQFAILFFGIDRFKAINDTIGQWGGDKLLMAFAQRCQQLTRPYDTLARLGGDEFAILLTGLQLNDALIASFAGRLQEALAAPFEVEEHTLAITTSMGIRKSSVGHKNLDTLLNDANLAMTKAKGDGQGSIHIFAAELRRLQDHERLTEQGIRRALAHDEFVLYYQPLLTLASGEIKSVEALIRWTDPERGMVRPDQFIGVAEACGLVIPITQWVLTAACKQARLWKEQLETTVRIGINLPPAILSDPALVEKVRSELERHELTTDALGLEIVESTVLESNPVVFSNLDALRNMGIQIAIDDFGTGYSSFSYLKQLPVSYLKIDRSFTRKVPDDPADTAICKALLDMAKELGLITVVEGVETKKQFDYLKDNGCQVIQGYYFSRPLPSIDCTQFLIQEARAPTSSKL